jgi:hypothetical protein
MYHLGRCYVDLRKFPQLSTASHSLVNHSYNYTQHLPTMESLVNIGIPTATGALAAARATASGARLPQVLGYSK